MMMLQLWVVTWSTHHLVLVRSTIGWDCHSLLLLALLVSTDCVIRNDSIADKLWKGSASAERKTLL
jgi:hypothetical protein